MTDQIVTRGDVEGVAVLTFATPGQRVNVVSDAAMAQLAAHVEALAADDDISAAVLISGKDDGFCAGADLAQMPELMALDDPRPRLAESHEVLRTLLDSPTPIVAAVHGPALGGGLELAMTCAWRIASDDPRTSFGTPEVRLGLLPGLGGTQLLPRLIPAPNALEHLLTGKTLYAARARAFGLADDVCPRNQLLDLAIGAARRLGSGELDRHPLPGHPLPSGAELDELMAGARAMVDASGAYPWPAPRAILDVVETGLRDGLEAGLAAEREAFARLLHSDEAAAGVHLFHATNDAKRSLRGEGPPAEKVFVLGGGLMGAGIGATLGDQRITVRVRDLSHGALARAAAYTDRVLRSKYEKRRSEFPVLYRERFRHLSTTTSLDGIGSSDVVIEAVFEDVDVKHRVIREAEPWMREDAIFASNTSAIPISVLAEVSQRPDRFVGMHFFSPAEKMPLVEIIAHPGTSQDTVARTAGLALQMGKTPIVVADSPGFYTSRVFARWLAEGTRLLADGATIEQVDRVAKTMGFPVGPLVAHDEVALDLVRKGLENPVIAGVTFGRVDATASHDLIVALTDAGHVGRKAGRGFYRYDEEGLRLGPDALVYEIGKLPGTGEVAEGDIRERLLWSFVTEALLCFDEGLLRTSGDGDVGAVLGIGFPPNIGGPFHAVDRMGAEAALQRIAALDEATPGAFATADSLLRLAESGGRYADEPARDVVGRVGERRSTA